MDETKKPRNETKAPDLSGNAPRLDRRVRRSRDALGNALVALLQERPFDEITVQDVLDRANVGRSTFYAHFRDKEDLFISDADEFFEALSMGLSIHRDPSERVAMVREFFEHVAEMQTFLASLAASGLMGDVMELARGHFAKGIERRLAELPRARGLAPEQRAAMAYASAGALLSLLEWWIARDMRTPAAEMDALFHRMIWQGAA